ncbi:SusC/RagA family TonB-linked outer membrane protein [Haliscomenobacter sp.]|uniref:SusC/RagA family TonB-linked outer membrane protein n=1 Tax=Haliscomenobacter sp. TaxID=2717303 RepID=UPI003BA8911F
MKKLSLVLALLLLGSAALWAQKTITGKVTDDNGEGLIGATILVKGTSVGSITDVSGAFSLLVPPNAAVLMVSYTGFAPKEVTLTDANNYEITMETEVIGLSDVVVVGYGSQSRKGITGSVAKVSGETLSKLPVTGVDQALQGQAAGVQVVAASGTPGGSVSVRVRGPSSINAGNQPLYVVDGVPISTGSNSQIGFGGQQANALTDINPTDIESIEVLKDASAAAIYGSRASNGVVLITTKRGKAGKTQVSLNTYYGQQEIQKKPETLTGPQYVALVQEAIRNRFTATSLPSSQRLVGLDAAPDTYPSTNWSDQILQTAPISQTDLSFSGGNERTKFYLSTAYFTQDGIIKGSKFDRYSIRLNLDNFITNKIKIGTSTFLSRSNSDRLNNDNNINGVLSAAILMGSHIPVRNADGTYAKDANSSVENPVAAQLEPTNENFSGRILSTLYGDWSILPWLSFRTNLNLDLSNFREFRFSPTTTNTGFGLRGQGIEAYNQELNLVNENFFTISKAIGSLNLDLLLGTAFQNSRSESFFGQGENFPGNTIKTLNAASVKKDLTSSRTEWGLNSYYSRLNLNFKEKYFVSGSVRRDGSSRFGANQRWALFPAFSAAWRVSEEPFLKGSKVISELKLRAGFGQTGNQNIGNFASRALISPGANYNQIAGLSPSQLGNPELTWETNEDVSVGLDLGFFNNRVSFVIEAYKRSTIDLLLNRPLVFTSGFASITENIGSTENRGIDILLNTRNIESKKFSWSTSFNVAFLESKIIKLAGTPFASGFASWVAEGEAPSAFRGFRVERIFQEQAEIDALNAKAREKTGNPTAVYQSTLTRPGDIQFKDLNGDGLITALDQEILGNALPKFYGGMTNNLSFAGFDLSFFFQFQSGNMIYNNTRAFSEGMNGIFGQSAAVLDRWTPDNKSTTFPRAVFGDPNNNRRTSDRFLEDGSFIRLKNLNFGYSLPKSITDKLKINRLRVYVGGQNLLTFTNYSGLDPEVSTFGEVTLSAGTDFLTFPQARTIMGGLNITF